MTLQLGPIDPDTRFDPSDPDVAGKLSARYGVHNNALRLIQQQAAVYEQIGPILALKRDEERTEAVRQHLDDVAAAIKLPKGAVLEDASVRGTDEDKLWVTYMVRYPGAEDAEGAGRSSRGALPWAALGDAVNKTYEEERERKLGFAAAARSAGALDEEVSGPEDPRVSSLQDEVKRLREQNARLTAAGAVPQMTHPPASSLTDPGQVTVAGAGYTPPAGEAPAGEEPVPGYAELNSGDAERTYKDALESDPALAERILAYERANKARVWSEE